MDGNSDKAILAADVKIKNKYIKNIIYFVVNYMLICIEIHQTKYWPSTLISSWENHIFTDRQTDKVNYLIQRPGHLLR